MDHANHPAGSSAKASAPGAIRLDRREKLLRIFGREDVDRVLKSLISQRGLSILTDKAVDELIRLTIADFKNARKLNALHRQIHARSA